MTGDTRAVALLGGGGAGPQHPAMPRTASRQRGVQSQTEKVGGCSAEGTGPTHGGSSVLRAHKCMRNEFAGDKRMVSDRCPLRREGRKCLLRHPHTGNQFSSHHSGHQSPRIAPPLHVLLAAPPSAQAPPTHRCHSHHCPPSPHPSPPSRGAGTTHHRDEGSSLPLGAWSPRILFPTACHLPGLPKEQ